MGLEDSWLLQALSTMNNGLTTSSKSSKKTVPVAKHTPIKPKLRWLGHHHFRYDLLAFSSKLNSFTEMFLTNATSEQDYIESFSSGRHISSKILSFKISRFILLINQN